MRLTWRWPTLSLRWEGAIPEGSLVKLRLLYIFVYPHETVMNGVPRSVSL